MSAFAAFLYADVSKAPEGSLCTGTPKKGSLFSAAVSFLWAAYGNVKKYMNASSLLVLIGHRGKSKRTIGT